MMSLNLNRTEFGSIANNGNLPEPSEVYELFYEWVKNVKLQLHMKQVGCLMKCWAKEELALDESRQWAWEMAGLLHDADWDQWPEQHCKKIIEELERRAVDPEVIRAIASHGPNHFGVVPITGMDKMLYAFDELSGLIHAYSLLRPGGYEGMDVKGVKKRLKEKSFAANVNREEIQEAANGADVQLDVLIEFIIKWQPSVS